MQKLPNYNPAEHTLRPEDRFMTRRDMLQRTGMGMGALSLAMLLGETSAHAAADPRHRPPHAAIPRSSRTLRPRPSTSSTSSPAAGRRTSTPGTPSRPSPSTKTRPSPASTASPSPRPSSSRRRASRASKSARSSRTSASASTTWPSSARCGPTSRPTSRRSRFMHTGSLQIPKPSLGSWVVYGLGTENQNMPGFISLGGKRRVPPGRRSCPASTRA